jgi:hypothetical protein
VAIEPLSAHGSNCVAACHFIMLLMSTRQNACFCNITVAIEPLSTHGSNCVAACHFIMLLMSTRQNACLSSRWNFYLENEVIFCSIAVSALGPVNLGEQPPCDSLLLQIYLSLATLPRIAAGSLCAVSYLAGTSTALQLDWMKGEEEVLGIRVLSMLLCCPIWIFQARTNYWVPRFGSYTCSPRTNG